MISMKEFMNLNELRTKQAIILDLWLHNEYMFRASFTLRNKLIKMKENQTYDHKEITRIIEDLDIRKLVKDTEKSIQFVGYEKYLDEKWRK